MAQEYNKPLGGEPSTIGTQIRTDFYQKKALIEAAKEQYFSQLADVTSMPKNMGKKIKRYHYLPLLDDANINDQGIDAGSVVGDGVGVGLVKATVRAYPPGMDGAQAVTPTVKGYVIDSTGQGGPAPVGGDVLYFTDENINTAGAIALAHAKASAYFASIGLTDESGADAAGWTITGVTGGVADLATVSYGGNLYGSSKDVGTISGKMPALSENGGRVNRVGFKRVELEADITKFGFFDEYTQESLDFDSDADLLMHITRESVMGANEITEDAIQIDLLNAAGLIRLSGEATQLSEIHGDTPGAGGIAKSEVSYEDFMRLSIDLDDNRSPKSTTVITGTRMIDTKVVSAARIMYVGTEMLPTLKRMKDLHGEKAYIEVKHYAAGTTVLRGEEGSIDHFRIVVVPEMMHWAGAGAAEGAVNGAGAVNDGYRATGGSYDVFPLLTVGDKSFTTIGFQTDGKSVKFKIKHSKPGSDTSYGFNDPYGEMGFYSIKWYYGSMILRPERIGLIKSVAEF